MADSAKLQGQSFYHSPGYFVVTHVPGYLWGLSITNGPQRHAVVIQIMQSTHPALSVKYHKCPDTVIVCRAC